MEGNNANEIQQKQAEARNQLYGSVRNTNSVSYPSTENIVAKIIRILAILEIIVGIIVGYNLADNDTPSLLRNTVAGFQWSIALTWWVSTIFSGLLLIGFSEIIKLLHEINNKTSC